MRASFLVEHLDLLIKDNNSPELKFIMEKMEIIPARHKTSWNNELAALIHNYNMESIEVGSIIFLGGYKVLDNGYLAFGAIDMDYLVLDVKNNDIILIDHDETNYVMLNCSKNPSSFVEILFNYINFTFYRLTKKEKYRVKNLEDIYKIAGGDKYQKFIDFLFQ